MRIRSLPPPHAGCPRGDPGPLPVRYLFPASADRLRHMSAQTLFDRLFLPDRAMRVAVLYEHAEITYEELRAGTVAVAEALSALGLGAGDRVAILLNDSPQFITSFVAIISLGAIAVPINLALRREDQLFILKDCGATTAIVEAKTAESEE